MENSSALCARINDKRKELSGLYLDGKIDAAELKKEFCCFLYYQDADVDWDNIVIVRENTGTSELQISFDWTANHGDAPHWFLEGMAGFDDTIMKPEAAKEPPMPSGRVYDSPAQLPISDDVARRLQKLEASTQIMSRLAALRVAVGMTQDDMAKKFFRLPAYVSDLELLLDAELPRDVLITYLQAILDKVSKKP